MNNALAGVTVIELAAWTFVPAGGATLADWGATVIKIEHPLTGDPARGLTTGVLKEGQDRPFANPIMEQPNRGKRSLAVDIRRPEGRELLLRLVEKSDVFLTNLLEDSLTRLRLTVEDLRERNPKIIYARGTGQGVRGPDATKGGFDMASYWSRGGLAYMLQDPAAPYPPLQRPAFGDIMGGFALAGGIAAALYRRAATGEPSTVDVSLLGVAVWNLAPDVVLAGLVGDENLPVLRPDDVGNPLTNIYRTSDGRYLSLVFLQADRHWPELCAAMDREDLLTDPRFATATDRMRNRTESIELLRTIFATRTLAEWKTALADIEGVWAPVQSPAEVHTDPQVVANGYLPEVTADDGRTFRLAANPVQFDETPPSLRRAPEHGEQTDEICLELGLDWEEIIKLKETDVLL